MNAFHPADSGTDQLNLSTTAKRSKRRMVQSLTVASPGPNRPIAGRWIPVPDIPLYPILSTRAVLGADSGNVPCVLDQGSRFDVCAGRIAIACAIELMGLTEGEEVLIPAYHCNAMVDPLAIAGARPVFYRINPDLSVSIEDIESKISTSSRALMVPHYFGFPQNLGPLRALCDRRGLLLLEDCAHSLFGSSRGIPLGSLGDYAIASFTKFLPVREGGSLVTKDPNAHGLPLKSQRMVAVFREAYGALEDATYHNRLGLFRPLINGLERTRSLFRSKEPGLSPTPNPAQVRSGTQGDLDRDWLHVKATPLTGFISRLVSRDFLVDRRTANYRRLAAGFRSLRGARTLVPTLPEGVVPYMFPLWVDRMDAVFPKLEDLAVPMQRFGQFLRSEVDSSVCPVSVSFSNHLLQLPCHQELTEDEMEWLIARVTATVTSA